MSDLSQFKRLSVEDLTSLMKIERAAYHSPWSASMMRDALLAAHYQQWGICEGEHIVGFGILSIVVDESELLAMTIDPQCQGKGYGRQLLDFLIKQAKQAHAEALFLEVRQSNARAIDLYEKVGFTSEGLRKGYYPDKHHARENAQLMKLNLEAVEAS